MQQMHTKRRNRWLEEYIGRTFAVICGWLIVLITVTMIIFLAVKGIQSFTDSGLSLSDMLLSMQGIQTARRRSMGRSFLLLARCSSRLALC